MIATGATTLLGELRTKTIGGGYEIGPNDVSVQVESNRTTLGAIDGVVVQNDGRHPYYLSSAAFRIAWDDGRWLLTSDHSAWNRTPHYLVFESAERFPLRDGQVVTLDREQAYLIRSRPGFDVWDVYLLD